jgi:hypothetical protein
VTRLSKVHVEVAFAQSGGGAAVQNVAALAESKAVAVQVPCCGRRRSEEFIQLRIDASNGLEAPRPSLRNCSECLIQ